ncbi:MAG: family 20 glycosylhydrolase [Verrucomicrobiae bacterium]|nr:family 20 glycosylhydrolase [Verrucomicrobiae bacterium]
MNTTPFPLPSVPVARPSGGAHRRLLVGVATCLACLGAPCVGAEPDGRAIDRLPVRGLHLSGPGKGEVAALVGFIRGPLSQAGVNTLVLEFGYRFDYQSRPEFADPSAPGKAEVREILTACRENGIELIPQINCLGHQSWAKRNDRLLQKHPEFDETPGKYPDNEGIYCRSYCPRHPEVHAVLFDLIDELAVACEAKAFHVGLDEVFILADPDCPRCRGEDPAVLFADEVGRLHAHLKEIGCRTWLWGDRFLDGSATGLGKWEASENGTQGSMDRVPKDLVVCDWHYNNAPETARLFAEKGFDVVSCPWRKPDVALAQLKELQGLRAGHDPAVAAHALGMLQTTWCGPSRFAGALGDLKPGEPVSGNSGSESANCFLTLFNAIRENP